MYFNNINLTRREKCPYSEFFWSVIFRILIEYGEIRIISPYSVQMRENKGQKNSEYGQFSHIVNTSRFMDMTNILAALTTTIFCLFTLRKLTSADFFFNYSHGNVDLLNVLAPSSHFIFHQFHSCLQETDAELITGN